ncbi:MAG: hypothetical protein JOY90_07235 [Bradyrhizobium sp.]|uniref:hypothetical protein n=1 Tax=Bradyrhizobium sp. TaxID=376 RepID=UPI001DA58415|nr:hypothetical protein [Bradyrhizobium sp.]MBV9560240.1 hypothetical protein [Bradyrhizobium sp.]
MDVPIAPIDLRQAANIGPERTTRLPLMLRDDLLGLSDLRGELGDELSVLGLRAGIDAFADRECRRIDAAQRLSVSPDLGSVPGDPAVTVRRHPTPAIWLQACSSGVSGKARAVLPPRFEEISIRDLLKISHRHRAV